jgi:hypothetical protein
VGIGKAGRGHEHVVEYLSDESRRQLDGGVPKEWPAQCSVCRPTSNAPSDIPPKNMTRTMT